MLLLLLSLPLSITLAQAALVNHTIDDEWGDKRTGVLPIYAPDNLWAQGSTCLTCHMSFFMDSKRPFDGTWHDSTYEAGGEDINITITFTGTAVYVYNILVNSIPFTTTATTLEFYVDGENVGAFTHSPDSSITILYDVPVYVNDTLSNTAHTLFINTIGAVSSLVLFDYILYTFDDSSGPLPSILPLTPSGVLPTVQAPSTQSETSTATAVASSTTSESLATHSAPSTTSALSTTSLTSLTSTVSHSSLNTTSFTEISSHSVTQHPHTTSISPSSILSTTTPHPASSSSSPDRTPRVSLGVIIGVVAGSSIAVGLIVSVRICYLRRRIRRRRPNHVVDLGKPAHLTMSESGHEFLIEPERGSQSVLDIGFSSPLQEAQYRARNSSAQRSGISSGVLAVVGTRESGFLEIRTGRRDV